MCMVNNSRRSAQILVMCFTHRPAASLQPQVHTLTPLGLTKSAGAARRARARAIELDDAAHLLQQRQPRGLNAQHVDDLDQVVAHRARRIHVRVAQHLRPPQRGALNPCRLTLP